MKIARMLVQDGEEHDDILHRKSFPVNIRLYKDNSGYRDLILGVIKYMELGAEMEFEDYPAAQGVSGANVGVPFNIVLINTEEGTEIFLNPEMVDWSEIMVECNSNCGSINLPKKIKVMRHRWVKVKYYTLDAELMEMIFRIGDDNPVSSATLQHEIEHNLGILITDKEVK